jgi:hypothetical protein
MDLDLSSLWSWTLPLWGLFVIVFFLGGVLTQPALLQQIGPSPYTQAGGSQKVAR